MAKGKKEVEAAKEAKQKLYINFYENKDGKSLLTAKEGEKGPYYIAPYGENDAVFIPGGLVHQGKSNKFITTTEDKVNDMKFTKLGPVGKDGKRQAPKEREEVTFAELKADVDAKMEKRRAEYKAAQEAMAAEAGEAEVEADGPEL